MSDPLLWIDDESHRWAARGLRRQLRSRGPTTARRFQLEGREVVNFGSNDYLGLAADARVVAAAHCGAETYGWGAGASPLVSGWTEAHEALCRDLAEFEQTEAVALFPTGFAANLGTIAALVNKDDGVYSDRLNHACLIDGIRLSRAALRIYPHRDADRLASLLERDPGRFRRSLIVTDGVFSMDGDLAPLDQLADLAERHSAMLLVDEAHGTGVFGPDGRGAASALGVAERVSIRVGTLSKALGSLGGFVAGSRRLIEWLVNHARPLIYSTGLPAAAACAAREALAIACSEPWRRELLFSHGHGLRTALSAADYETGSSSGPIVPVLLNTPEQALQLAEQLLRRGFFVPAIRPPTVPEGTSRLRITVTAAHSEEDVAGLVDALVAARD